MKVKTAVVILNWNGRKFLEQFLPLVISRSHDQAAIIVADNASTDDSVDMLRHNFPEIEIIINPTNSGYAGGYNEALKQVDAEYYILLNSDIEVGENWIEPVIAMMDADKSIAACQPKIRSYFDPESFEYAGAAGGFLDTFGYPFCRGRLFQTIEKDNGQFGQQGPVCLSELKCFMLQVGLMPISLRIWKRSIFAGASKTCNIK
jgi:hypothetical protein